MPRAFSFRVDDPTADIHILSGHDYAKPLASRKTGTLVLRDTEAALEFDATITRVVAETTWGRDAIAALVAGIVTGLSPGFRLPPPRIEKEKNIRAETIEHERDDGPGSSNRGAIIRSIYHALLFELSLVTMAAYSQAQVELRDWSPTGTPSAKSLPEGVPVVGAGSMHATQRWR